MVLDEFQLGDMNEKLFFYDDKQNGWEKQPNGFEGNAYHVLTHLVKDAVSKDFEDREIVSTSIAPDSLQYALRLGRWSYLSAAALLPKTSDLEEIHETATKFSHMPLHQFAFIRAAGYLAKNLHDLGHTKDREAATADRIKVVKKVGRLLIYSAEKQSEDYDFDLVEAFDYRLAALRERFGIPQPV